MPKYLSSRAYARADEGLLSVPTLSAGTLKRFIERAERMVDAYCGFDARLGGFEPHNIWYQVKWDRKNLKTRIPIWPVPVRAALRYRIQVSMIGGNNPSNGFFATIQNGDVAYNTFGNYVEIVPLQAVLYSMLPVLVELGMNPPVAQLDLEMGYYLDEFGDTLEDNGDHSVYFATRGFWATTYDQNRSIIPNTVPVVAMMNAADPTLGQSYTTNPLGLPFLLYKNGTLLTTNLSINTLGGTPGAGQVFVDPVEGTVTFGTPNVGSDVIKAAYTYQIPDAVREATLAQTTYLLAQRDLTRQGMRALDIVQTAQQMLQRHNRAASSSDATTIDEPSMDPVAMQLLQPYRQYAVG